MRPLDFAFVLNLGQSSHAVTDFEPLYRGAEGARTAFPVAGSRLRQPPFDLPSWETRPGAPPALVIRVFPEGERELRIQEFSRPPSLSGKVRRCARCSWGSATPRPGAS